MKIRRYVIAMGLGAVALNSMLVACTDSDDGDSEASDTPTPTAQEAESPDTQAPATQETASPDTTTPTTREAVSPGAGNPRDADLATATFALSWQDAVAQAQQRFQGDLTSVELDWDDGRWAYTVELISGSDEYEVDIDAETGEILDEEMDDDDDGDEIIDVDRVIPLQDAIDAALGARQGRIEEWKLDGTSRGAQFEFEIDTPDGDDVEVDVDAYTGEVLSIDD